MTGQSSRPPARAKDYKVKELDEIGVRAGTAQAITITATGGANGEVLSPKTPEGIRSPKTPEEARCQKSPEEVRSPKSPASPDSHDGRPGDLEENSAARIGNLLESLRRSRESMASAESGGSPPLSRPGSPEKSPPDSRLGSSEEFRAIPSTNGTRHATPGTLADLSERYSRDSRDSLGSAGRTRRPSLCSNASAESLASIPEPEDGEGAIALMFTVVMVGPSSADVANMVCGDHPATVFHVKHMDEIARFTLKPLTSFKDEMPHMVSSQLPATAFVFILDLGWGDEWDNRLNDVGRRAREAKARSRFMNEGNASLMPVMACIMLKATVPQPDDQDRASEAKQWAESHELDMLFYGSAVPLEKSALKVCLGDQLCKMLVSNIAAGKKDTMSRSGVACGCSPFACLRGRKS